MYILEVLNKKLFNTEQYKLAKEKLDMKVFGENKIAIYSHTTDWLEPLLNDGVDNKFVKKFDYKALAEKNSVGKYSIKIPTVNGRVLYLIASKHSYSTPRKNLDQPNYTEWEVALFTEDMEWEQPKPFLREAKKHPHWDLGDLWGVDENEEKNSWVLGYIEERQIIEMILCL